MKRKMTCFLLIAILLMALGGAAYALSPDTDLSAADASFRGENAGDFSGASVAPAGDVNGDGYDDILIGAYLDDDGGSDAGQTYLILGKAGGWAMDTDLSAADASFWGEDEGDRSGYSVAPAGDVNGDGYDDILIGAYANDDGGDLAGQSYLILGKTSGWAMDTDLSAADASFIGEDAGDYSGLRVASAGDVNGDGYDDILIGAIYDEDGGSDAGQSYLILGKAGGWAMDTDLSTADASFGGEDAGDESGISVAPARDVNGDGYDDILIGAYGADDGGTDAGQSYLILGKASGWAMDTDLSAADASFWGEDAGDRSGVSVASAGDVNGDGYADILIGAYLDDDGGDLAGQSYLILGKASGWAMDTSLSDADASFIGEDAGDSSGLRVASAGDVNGDGYDDILIGAYANDDGGSDAGQSYLILGKASGWTMDIDLSQADASFIGEDAFDYSGCCVASVGDVNGDGGDDILIGAFGDEDGGTNAGQSYLLLSDYALVTSCDASGSAKNQFCPGQTVYVKASGLTASATYKIWIQDDPVSEGDSLVPGENPSATTPKEVTTDGSGNLAPTLIWSIPAEAATTYDEYDIVFDNQSAGTVGTFDAANDYIDSLGVVGFVAPVPELSTIILLSIGLAGMAAYIAFRARRRAKKNA
ncbi:integrin alpha [Chloroflexota bacterium]